MNRLTEKIELFNGVKTFKKNNTISNQEIVIKLGRLEDIEERLGIDLITFLQGIDPDTCLMEITKENKFYFSADSYYGEYSSKGLLELIQNLLFMYHKLKERDYYDKSNKG